jgi:hypothetical protein
VPRPNDVPLRRPRRAHEPVELRLLLRRTPEGTLLISSPLVPGWCVPAACPAELALAVEQAWCEAQVAAYARLRGVMYDLAETVDDIPRDRQLGARHPAEPAPAQPPVDEVARRRRVKHPATHDPEDWVELSDGYWQSPGGRRYAPHTPQAQRALVARGRL